MITTIELMEKTGATSRQIGYWAAMQILPSHRDTDQEFGFFRKFDESVIDRVRLLTKISNKFHGTLPKDILQKIWNHYEDEFVYLGDGIEIKWRLYEHQIGRTNEQDGRKL